MAFHFDVVLALIIMEVNVAFALSNPDVHDENIDIRKLCPMKCPPGFSSSCPRNVESRCVRCTQGVNYSKHHSRSASCRPCSRCRVGEFEAEPCTIRKDVVCQKCSECPPGFGVRSLCAKTSDTVCDACPLGTASDENSKVEVCKPCAMCKEKGIHPSSEETESQSLDKKMNEGKLTVENLLYFTPQKQIAPGEDYEHPSMQVVQKAGTLLRPTGGGEIVVNVMKPSSESLPTFPLSTSSPFSSYNTQASFTARLTKKMATISTDPDWLESKQSPSAPVSSVIEDSGPKRSKSTITEETMAPDRRRTEEPSSHPRENITEHASSRVVHGTVLYNHKHKLTITKRLETKSIQEITSEGTGTDVPQALLKSTERNSIVKDAGRERNKAVNQMSSSLPIPKWLVGGITVVVMSFFAVGVFLRGRQKRRMTSTVRNMFSCPPSSECCHSDSASSIPGICSDKSSEETDASTSPDTTLHTYLTNDTTIVRADVHHEAKPTSVFTIFGIDKKNHSSTSWANSQAENLTTQVHDTFDSAGGELRSPDSNVRVYIPAGALPQDTSQPIFFGVVFDETELLQNIPETPQRTLICPVIKCGPSHVTFLKPVKIVLPHCLYLEETKKDSISVYRCGEISDNAPEWESVPSSSERTSQSMSWFKVKNDTIVIKTKCFSYWSVFACGGPKKKRASVFASRPSEDSDTVYLRFYIYSDTEDSSKRVQAQEKKSFHDSTRCTKEKPFKMFNDNKQIEVELTGLEDGWTLRDKTRSKVIYTYESAYKNGFRVRDSCDFVVKPTRSDVEPFSCTVSFQQEDHPPEKTMYLNTAIKPGKSSQNNNNSSTVESSFQTGAVEDARQEAPPRVRFLLDIPPEPLGSENEPVTEQHCLCIQEKVGVNWKKLLRKLGINEDVIKIIDEENRQVTEKCYQGLIQWINRSGSAEATTRKLCQALHSIGSSEAIKALKDEGLLAEHGTAVSESSSGFTMTV